AMAVVVKDATLLVVGDNGVGKRTPFDMTLPDGTIESVYRLQSRGGKGIITMKTTEKTGGVVGALPVRESDEIMVITAGGREERTFVKDIPENGRNAQRGRGIKLDPRAKIKAIAPGISEKQHDNAGGRNGRGGRE